MISSHLAQSNSISFGEKLAASAAFDALFRDGMSLVEETAAYLDGAGRDESRALSRIAALAYASESMRLTTRLMQIASWLLLQRAVNEGEMTQREAATDKRRSRHAWQITPVANPAPQPDMPSTLVELIDKSHRLQDRVQRLDVAICEPVAPPASDMQNAVEAQFAMLRRAFPT